MERKRSRSKEQSGITTMTMALSMQALISLSPCRENIPDALDHSNAYPEGSKINWWVGKGQSNRAAVAAK